MKPFKKHLHRLLAMTLLRPGRVRRAWFGPYRGIRFALSPAMMTRLGAFYRAYEPDVTDWLSEHIRPGMQVVVVGGHIGIHALYIAQRLRGQGQVIVFEGWPENVVALRQNAALNAPLQPLIEVRPQCIAAVPGEVQMAQGTADGKHHLAASGESGHITVEATTLDALWRETQRCPAIVLVDIEGFELDALRGSESLLQTCRPVWVLEHHGRAAELHGWLSARGYRVEPLGRRHLIGQP
jgi:FkbM family methyltransferase